MSRGCCRNGKKARLRLLGHLVLYSAHYQWPALLKFHAAVLSEVEKGMAGWEYDYSRLEQQTLMPFPLTKQKEEQKIDKSSRSASGANNGGRQENRVVYCGDFQNDACNLQDNHGGQFFGQSVYFQHIGATCWKRTKTRAYHPASSMDCPFYEHWLTRLAPAREGNTGAIPHDGRCLSNGVMTECERLLEIHEKVMETGSPNFESAKIPIKSRWNIDHMRRHLYGYHDQMVVTLCEYGWPIGITDSEKPWTPVG